MRGGGGWEEGDGDGQGEQPRRPRPLHLLTHRARDLENARNLAQVGAGPRILLQGKDEESVLGCVGAETLATGPFHDPLDALERRVLHIKFNVTTCNLDATLVHVRVVAGVMQKRQPPLLVTG